MREALLGLAENPALTDELFARLVAAGDEEVLHTLAGREQLTTAQIGALLDVGDPQLTRCLVRRGGSRVPHARLYRVEPDENGGVRESAPSCRLLRVTRSGT
ncbi:hypothetical protein [Streptomyces sp. NPDC002825]|uniref:hypothetical protein n=1 Tax=Streptomyces sp. NPDC002825 TaxID=3154666 RepID=UPI0033245435